MNISDGEIIEMTYEQRRALPGEYHQPHWDGLGVPHSWICTVCWDDGLTHAWPCDVATREGKAVAEAGGMKFSW
jgi:hypothetical protein